MIELTRLVYFMECVVHFRLLLPVLHWLLEKRKVIHFAGRKLLFSASSFAAILAIRVVPLEEGYQTLNTAHLYLMVWILFATGQTDDERVIRGVLAFGVHL